MNEKDSSTEHLTILALDLAAGCECLLFGWRPTVAPLKENTSKKTAALGMTFPLRNSSFLME
jgi:hypothetical protein